MSGRIVAFVTGFVLTCCISVNAQDSSYYFVSWVPKKSYQKARVKQEGVLLYHFVDGIVKDSFLMQVKIYDSLGQVIKLQHYLLNKLRTQYTSFYSGLRLDSMLQEEFWLSAKIMHRYKYDENGNLLQDEAFNGGTKTIHYRYTYNRFNQVVKVYLKIGDEPEFLCKEYTYKKDGLVLKVDHYYDKSEATDNFSYIYTYANGNRTISRFFQRMSKEKRFIDCIHTYDAQSQLVNTIKPPLPRKLWLPPALHSRKDEIVENYIYLPGGLLSAKQIWLDDKLVMVEKHIYFF